MNISNDVIAYTAAENTTPPHDFVVVEDSVHHPHWRDFPQLDQSAHTVFAMFGAVLFGLSVAGNVSVIFLFKR